MVADWIRLLGGMLSVRVRGAELERFLNLCKQERIELRKIKRVDIDELHAELSVRDFYRLFLLKKRRRCRVHILQRHGLPFWMRKLSRRYALWIGLLLVCFVCYELTTRIWVIRTDFPQGVDGYAVLRELDELGIGIGSKSEDIDAHAVKVHMMTTLDDLKFFALNLDGNVMSIETAAATETPEVDVNKGVRDVVALQDGVVQKIIVRRGTAKCKIGDAVVMGQILVDALVEPVGELGEARLVDANADIWAQTRYTVTRKMALESEKKQKTDTSKTRYAIIFGKTRINLYFGSSLTPENCDRIISIEEIQLNEHFVLPISLYCETITPYETQAVTHEAEELAAQLEYGAKCSVQKRLNEGSISSVESEIREENGAAVVRARIWCYEQIGESVEDGRTQADIPQQSEEEQTEQ